MGVVTKLCTSMFLSLATFLPFSHKITNCIPSRCSSFFAKPKLPKSFIKQTLAANHTASPVHVVIAPDGAVVPQHTNVPTAPTIKEQSDVSVLFSPDDNVQETFMSLVAQEQKAIKFAAFSLTNPLFTQAFCKASDRGIIVECVLDPNCLHDRKNQIKPLCDKGITVYIYNPNYDPKQRSSCMHHKFVLFEQNGTERSPVVWTGSFNLTKAALSNQENVVIIKDSQISKRFERQFDLLTKRSYKLHA